MRVSPDEFRRLDLRVHSLLADVPLHDVWAVDLPGGGPGRTLSDLEALLDLERVASANPAVRLLFSLRRALGAVFRWERPPAHREAPPAFRERLSEADRRASLVEPGTPEGPFRVVYVFPTESVNEICNATVHAASCFTLVERTSGYRLYWAIYVRPVGRFTAWYMRLIDPFRRHLIYPAVLRSLQASWAREFAT
jgi:hypothetical protein